MKLPTLTQIGKGEAYFLKYRSGELWYSLFWREDGGPVGQTCDGVKQHCLDFPIPISDSGDGDFIQTMSGMSVLRWVRKHVELIRQARESYATEAL